MRRLISGALTATALFIGTPAISAVVTTGCVADCTLSELFAGGTIQVDDVLFDGFAAGSNFGVDVGAITVTGSTFAGDVQLAFSFAPALSVLDGDAAELDFDYSASVAPPSTRQVDGATLDLLGAGVSGPFSFVEVNTDIGGELLTVDLVGTGAGDVSDAVAFTALSLFSIGTDFQIEADDDGAASLSQFLVTLSMDGGLPNPQVIPLPAGAPLLLAGLAGFALLRRRTH